jgi:hypothetical protein
MMHISTVTIMVMIMDIMGTGMGSLQLKAMAMHTLCKIYQ